MSVGTDYQGISILLAASAASSVMVLTGLVNMGLQIATFLRQGKMQVAAVERDHKLAEIHDLVNGQSAKLNALSEAKGFVEGGNAERANPTEPK